MPPQSTRFDNPLPRLPWVMGAALLIWGALLCGLGLIVRQIDTAPQTVQPIDVQLSEMQPPHATVARPPRAVPARKPPPAPESTRRPPGPTPQAAAHPQNEAPSTDKPSGNVAGLSSPVALPSSSLPGGKGTPDTLQPAFGFGAGPPKVSRGPVYPPLFGAAYLNNPKPVYPASAKKMGMEGKVMLKVFVSREGRVLNIEIGQSSGYEILDKAALEAVKNWCFVPARQGESPRDEWVQVPVAFLLRR